VRGADKERIGSQRGRGARDGNDNPDHRPGRTAKIRNPWAVLLFTLITLGIYYSSGTTRSTARCRTGESRTRLISVCLREGACSRITIGSILIIPPFVSIWGTGKRMQLAQRTADVHGGSGLLWFVLQIIPVVSLFAPVYLQYQLNQVWDTRPEPLIDSTWVAPAHA
jgi:hypothetical protein